MFRRGVRAKADNLADPLSVAAVSELRRARLPVPIVETWRSPGGALIGAVIKVFPGVPGGEEGNRIGAADIKGSGQGIRVRRTAGQARVDAYTGNCYHQACDAVDDSWNLEGAAQDVDLMLDIGRDLATSTRWPEWKPGSEFKAIRDKSTGARQ